jgi:hypothetical protein
MAQVEEMRTTVEIQSDLALVEIYKTKAEFHDRLSIELRKMEQKLSAMRVDAVLDIDISNLVCQIDIFRSEAISQRSMADTLRKRIG